MPEPIEFPGVPEARRTPGLTKTIFIYSPDMSFCHSLSMLFHDRFNVVTSTNKDMIPLLEVDYHADLVVIDSMPSEELTRQIALLRERHSDLPVLLLFVFSQKYRSWEDQVRPLVSGVFYKPVDMESLTSRVIELLAATKS